MGLKLFSKLIDIEKILEKYGEEETFKRARDVARDYAYKLREQKKISFSEPKEGDCPALSVMGETLPEVWENTMMALMGIGQEVHTHYDPGHEKKEYESFPSLEATTTIYIEKPFSEPRFHKHFMGGGLGFGNYKAEMEGAKDSWVLDPATIVNHLKQGTFEKIKDSTEWLYSYSQRIRKYPYIDIEGKPQTINQLNSVIKNLVRNPLSRSAQVITWDPRWDHNDGQMKYRGAYPDGDIHQAIFDEYHAPCLQRIHFRLIPLRSEEGYKLNCTTHWRSRDHLKALPHNIYGILEGILEPQREALEKALKVPVVFGRYIDISDSLHLYGHYFDPRQQGHEAKGYLQDIFKIAMNEPIEERVIMPGTPLHEMILENIEKEYNEIMKNPNKGRN